jgi:hypothetical protein
MSDHIAELNERPKLGGGDGGVNVALWVFLSWKSS